jgi:hypothetical protein
MKILGRIETKINDEGEIENVNYLGGAIIALTEREAKTLTLLQEACNGYTFRYENIKLPDDEIVSDVFIAIRAFVEAKFEVNTFRELIDRLDSMLMKKENRNE